MKIKLPAFFNDEIYAFWQKPCFCLLIEKWFFLPLVATEKGKKERLWSVRILLQITYDKIKRTEYIFYLGNGIFDDNIKNKRQSSALHIICQSFRFMKCFNQSFRFMKCFNQFHKEINRWTVKIGGNWF